MKERSIQVAHNTRIEDCEKVNKENIIDVCVVEETISCRLVVWDAGYSSLKRAAGGISLAGV